MPGHVPGLVWLATFAACVHAVALEPPRSSPRPRCTLDANAPVGALSVAAAGLALDRLIFALEWLAFRLRTPWYFLAARRTDEGGSSR
jgi:hypothetical protein